MRFTQATGLSAAKPTSRNKAAVFLTKAFKTLPATQVFGNEAGTSTLRPLMLFTEHVQSCVSAIILERHTGWWALIHLSPRGLSPTGLPEHTITPGMTMEEEKQAYTRAVHADCVNYQLKPLLDRAERAAASANHPTASVDLVLSHGYHGESSLGQYLQDVFQPSNTPTLQVAVHHVNLAKKVSGQLAGATYVICLDGVISAFVISTSISTPSSLVQSFSNAYAYKCPSRIRGTYHHPTLFNALSLGGSSPEKDIWHGEIGGIPDCIARFLEPSGQVLKIQIIDMNKSKNGDSLHKSRVLYSRLYWDAVDKIVATEHSGVLPAPLIDIS